MAQIDNPIERPGGETIWSYRRVVVYGSSIHFFAGCPLIFLYAILRQFYAIFALEGIDIRGLMYFRNVEKPSDYQAISAFREIH